MSKRLLDSSESSDEEVEQIKVNNDFAKNYDNWRRKEELQKLKDKYGSNLDILSDSEQSFVSGSGEGSDDSESESEESVGKNEKVFDDNFFKVYSALKNKNPVIYDKDFKFFDENKNEDNSQNETKKKKEKIMTLTDYHLKLIKEKKGITDEDLQLMNGSEDKPVGYYEELDQIRDEFKTILNCEPTEGDSDEELIKGKPQIVSSQKEKKVNLLDEDNDMTEDPELNKFMNYWKNDMKLEESELFLRDYIINKRYVDKPEEKEDELYRKPNPNRTQDSDNERSDENDANNGFETMDDINKDKEIDLKINDFHFEEPNAISLKRFPRNIETIRDTTDMEKRALKRSETKDRKKREKQKELKHLRKLKKEELKQKLTKIQEISGNQEMDWNDLDLNVILDDDKEFDAQKYDQKMKTLFGTDYYDNNNSKTKPEFEYIPEIDDDLQYNEDIDNNRDNQSIEITNDNKSKNHKMNDKKKKKINKAMEEIGIFEDLIGGDLATRYKYRTVESNDFGLTDEEILFSDDKELNRWCSLKKMSQYREDNEEKYDLKSYQNKAQNSELKRKVLKSFYEKPFPEQNITENDSNLDTNNDNQSIDNNINDNKKKNKKRRHKKPKFIVEDIIEKGDQKQEEVQQNGDTLQIKKKSNKNKRFRRNKQNNKESPYPGVSVERLKAYGLSNRKIKKIKQKSK